MKAFAKENALGLFGNRSVDELLSHLFGASTAAPALYKTPTHARAQVALSKLLAYFAVELLPVCLHVTGWSIGSTEHMDLFDGYRRSHGGKATLD
jgi:hypothetical protein